MEQERKKRGLGGWIFLLLVLALYGMTGAVDAGMASQALRFFAKVMQNVLPALVIVFFLLLAADLLFEPKWIRRHLGREAGIKGWFLAAVGGVLATGPIYAWYALLRELRGKGMRVSLAAVFLYSRAVKLPLLPLMIHYFGTAYTLVLCLYLLGFSIVNGALMVKLEDRETT
ncbi:MAG: hypothetical protein PVF75_03990 [Granulosicoccaceae bacterium]|jgi:uncharacterized membrane protein YraQ (UPF0718 family)